ncbi:MAG: S41 family peptidase [Bryobacteraceae bacterium]
MTSLALAAVLASPAAAQLTVEQKLFDFQQMAASFGKNYAPLEWKRQIHPGLDLFDLRAWTDRVRATKNDLEFADLCFEFAAQFDDGHTQPAMQSDFVAFLPIATDVYDGKVLIEAIDRRALPPARYPFVVGSEVVTLDGVPAEQWLERLAKYSFGANALSNRRFAADYMTFRPQAIYPFAHRLADTAMVGVRMASGDVEEFEMAWVKRGTPVENFGKVPNQRFAAASDGLADSGAADDWLRRMRNLRMAVGRPLALSGFGNPAPYYRLPAGFRVRLGLARTDAFVSGTYQAEGLRIGYIRFGSFDGSTEALTQFITEVQFFEANTDGLVIDDTRNPGGDACYTEALLRLLMPAPFRTLGFQIRPTASLLTGLSRSLTSARANGAEQFQIDQLEALYTDISKAYQEDRGLTGPLPLCGLSLDAQPVRDRAGALISYDKPILVLTDELSASAADAFAAVMQDNGRAVIFGMRTMGLGGALFSVGLPLTTYSEIEGSVTGALMVRARDIVSSEYPTAPFIENIGVRPDIYYDYMTAENLTTQGVPFVRAFTAAMVDTILGR